MRRPEAPFYYQASGTESGAQTERLKEPITVMVIEDDPDLLEMLVVNLESTTGLKVLGQFDRPEDFYISTGITRKENGEFVRVPGEGMLNGTHLDVVITDGKMNGNKSAGLEIAKAAEILDSRVILETAEEELINLSPDERQTRHISAIVKKPFMPDELVESAITQGAQSRASFSPRSI